MTQKQHNQELPEKRRWDPVFVRRLWVTIAVVVVALSAGLAIYFENNRAAEAAKKADEKGEFIIQTPETVESIIEKGSVDEMLQFGQTQALVNRNQEFILVYEQMQDRVKLYQELERRSGDLDDRKQQLIKQQLLSSQFDLLIACHEEGLVDAELESNAKATANRLIEDKNNEISRQAHMAVSSMHLMSAFAKDRESDEIDIAYKSVGSLLKRYPDDAKVVDMTFFLLRTLGSEERDIEVTDEFYNLLIQHCANSKRENIRLSGHGFRIFASVSTTS